MGEGKHRDWNEVWNGAWKEAAWRLLGPRIEFYLFLTFACHDKQQPGIGAV
jgi:hypothetical protein